MRKILFKTLLVISGALLILSLTFFVYYLMVTKDYHLDESKLVNLESSAEIYDAQGNFMTESAGGLNITDLKDVPQHTVNAFIAIEDKRFYKHNGIDTRGVIRAIFNNVKSFSFKEGASTISQQLIKNTHLSSDKTLNRKLAEMKLARELEKRYSKDEIIEKYLNTIYFGNGCYGISSAAEKYFGVAVSELSLNQSAILAGMIKAPSTYSPLTNPQKCFERKNVVLKEMYDQNLISKAEYSACVDSFEEISDIKTENSSYIYLVNKACDDILE
ncbi:MAG: transglycosylase domain-containing protein, partial [Clostridia bacterium]|nr:transglycosylase domain-containing protein [Clostridia bacterium]